MQHHGYKRDKFTNVINLIINEENKTEDLKHDIYVNEKGTIYISEEDIKNLFDPTIYYDEKYNQIITTSNTKVASIAINQKQMVVNNSNISMLDEIIKINNDIYLPISDMAIVYNIKVDYIESTKKVVIDELDTGMIRAIATSNTDMKFRPRGLSKNIGNLKQGETVYCYYTTSKGWRQVRKADGTIGYVKANKLGEEYIVRQDMQKRGQATKIQKSSYDNKSFEISENDGVKIVNLKNVFNISKDSIEVSTEGNNNESNNKIWTVITNNSLGDKTSEVLEDYKMRSILIDLITKKAIENDINGISIEFTGIEDKESLKRFVIECTPKLREVGISTCVVLNDNIEEQDYINVVDYIVEQEEQMQELLNKLGKRNLIIISVAVVILQIGRAHV